MIKIQPDYENFEGSTSSQGTFEHDNGDDGSFNQSKKRTNNFRKNTMKHQRIQDELILHKAFRHQQNRSKERLFSSNRKINDYLNKAREAYIGNAKKR